MYRKVGLKKIGIILGYITIGLIMILCCPSNLDSVLMQNYIVDIFAYFIMAGIFLIIFIKNGSDILEPIVLISAIYITMFSIIPISDIATGEILWFGANLFEYGVKGTIIAIIGYIAFCIGYTLLIKNRYKWKKVSEVSKQYYDQNKIILTSMIGWIVCLILSSIYLKFNAGENLIYIFTLGFKGKVNASEILSTPLGFVSMFSYSLIPTCLIYSHYGKSKPLKLIMFFCTSMIQLIRGFRFIVLILLLAYIFLYYLKKNKRPSTSLVLSVIFLFIILIGIMGFYRGAIRYGDIVYWNKFSWKDISDALFDNFRIYKTYYAIIKAVPLMTPYMYGKQMFIYTLIMFIPRALWTGKPEPPGMEAVVLGISSYAAIAGQAYPCIGEYYYEYGSLGVVFFMYFFGICMKNLKNKYLKNIEDDFGLIIYSIMVPTTFQLIIRGYTPSNFYLVVFLLLPIILIRYFSKKSVNLYKSEVK